MPENMSHPPQSPSNETPLESWKEIAAYLKRGVRTVKRWEKHEGLPVHRHIHQARSTVYAYPTKLDAWWATRQPRLQEVASWHRPVPLLALASLLLLALVSSASGPLTSSAAATDEAAGLVVRQVWAEANTDSTGAVSPDGRYLSFANWYTAELAVRDLLTGENRDLTDEGTWAGAGQFAYYSIWSPDGKQIAYLWVNQDHSEVRVTSLTGGKPRVLYVHPEKGSVGIRPMAWSRDGKFIVGHARRLDHTNQIVLLSTDNGSVRVIKTTDWRYPLAMSFSPDGRWIAYDAQTEQDAPERDIFLLAVDGSREVVLVKHPAHDYGAVWTPDGKQVLFVSNRSGSDSLWSLALEDGQLWGKARLLKSDVGRMIPLGLTQDGTLYYGYASGQNRGDVYLATLDAATGKVVGTAERAILRYEGNNTSPAFPPDGKQLAYLSRRGPMGGGTWVLVIHSLETGKERVLTTSLASLENPRASSLRWSPNGRFLLAAGVDPKGRRGLYRIEVETGQASLVTSVDFPVETVPAWSPDGETVFLIRRNPDEKAMTIVAHRVSTGTEQVLYRTSWITALALSRDGERLAFFEAERVEGKAVAVLKILSRADGSSRGVLRMKMNDIGPYASATWTEDGRYLLFTRRAREGQPGELAGAAQIGLWRIAVEGGEPEKLDLELEGMRNLALGPGGRHLAFTAGRPFAAEVWVLENFLPALKAAR